MKDNVNWVWAKEKWSGYGEYYIRIIVCPTPKRQSSLLRVTSEEKINISQREITTINYGDYIWKQGL